ncbi:hypothetical protein PIB30_023148 [Stylosanthes scabra]|uniref:WRKY domain-containing protein n=1 Tax=Stylosanthes scabra TaxID=79078 RepID=A0ABU6R9M7_9FABA|nr:hypothetical protein [Stylosanthes scabra]
MEKNLSSDSRDLMEALIRGRGFANQLLQVVGSNNNNNNGEEVIIAEDLLRKVLRSFNNTILLLNGDSLSNGGASSASPKPKKFEGNRTFNNQPSRYKKRKTLSTPTWEKESSTLMDDGYAWRKYGQKLLLNSNYLRNYFRCSYKFDEGCEATKQVQRIQEDPPLYRTTYHGYHTCKNKLLQNYPNDDEMIQMDYYYYCDSPQQDSCCMVLDFSDPLISQ